MANNLKNVVPAVEIRFPEPIHGYWDGVRSSGLFRVETVNYAWISGKKMKHPGPGVDVKWGCYALNLWFRAKSGTSWNHAARIAARKLLRLAKNVPSGTTIAAIRDPFEV